MRRFIAATVLGAAVAGVGLVQDVALAAPPAAPAPAAKPADQAQVPVRQVVLFSSGVGYFEHYGTVSGTGSTELRFKTQQINDILKSLVLQDLDKGRITTITYPSQDPIAKTLRSFQVDITSNPSLADLLTQLRGAKVTIAAGAERVSGTILGVEKKSRPVGKGDDAKVIDVWVVNLLTGASIRSVSLEDVKDVTLEDATLQDELTKALAALAAARDQDKKPVTINFQGQGERRVRIGYVVETPVWKTSYRLVLDDDAPVVPAGGALGAGEKPATRPATQPAGKGSLQGWSIVENQTDNDWDNVQLSLVSGRPISFIQDLYQPLYIPRPVVQPELYASLRPQTYEGGIELAKDAPEDFAKRLADDSREQNRARANRQLEQRKSAAASEAADGAGFGLGVPGAAAPAKPMAPMDPTASVNSIASAAKVGELFQYTVGSVSLPRQKSAMIPIITDPVEVEKLSIYNQAVLPKNPLFGARVKNTTGKHLLQGPVTVLVAGTYAGDARIDDLPPGQERLISYGVDQQVRVIADNRKNDSTLQTGKIVKGVLHLTHKDTATQEYVAENKGEKAKTLLIEHPRNRGNWTLSEPTAADETTDVLYRFKDVLAPRKPKKLTVKEQVVRGQTIAILSMDFGAMDVYSKAGPIPQPVKDALIKAAQLKQLQVVTQREIQERQKRIAEITQEQNRIRENMKTVPQNTEYYTRLLTKLGEQETQIETLQKEVQELQIKLQQQRKALEDYLAALDVG